MKPFELSASILSCDFARMGDDVQAVIDAGVDRIHMDVMDQHYVPNLTMGPMFCQALRDHGIAAPIDVHLMVEPVDLMIDAFGAAGATTIVFHPEASRHVDRSLGRIHELGCQAGLALNPATPIHQLDHVMHHCDVVLLMSVNPGFGGQSFMPTAIGKASSLRAWLHSAGFDAVIEMDGGIKVDNIAQIAGAGVTRFVSGSGIFQTSDYRSTVSAMRAALSELAPASM